ncbi:hypothetical protein PYK22_02265 [Pyrinomonas methylaliphatogenes]|uniref:Uncharacterized protein n=1 Tax=Pyrinomonas methylaliphatogenes TaxID=454194 RepID=A0A0B6X1K1_9BACT|nr:hypothetical protein PYK22_02265 [Pyrinomonas methylaliphatogenes]
MSVQSYDDIATSRFNTNIKRNRNIPRMIINQAYFYIRVRTFELCDYLARAIIRHSINYYDFIISAIILLRKIFKDFTNETLFVVARDDYRNKGGRRVNCSKELLRCLCGIILSQIFPSVILYRAFHILF